MLIRENSLNIMQYAIKNKEIEALLNKNFLVLDIETTGFHRTHAKIIIIGMIYKENNQYKFIQIFIESLDEEKELLHTFKSYIESFTDFFYITYNGHAFDLPFINAKFKQHNIDFHLNLGQNLDLYRVIRKNKDQLGLNRYTLKSVEKLLGIHRQDQISGKESIKIFYDYLETKNNTLKEKILLHNAEDIEYLMPLTQIFNHIDYKTITAFIPKKIIKGYYLTDFKVQKDFLIATVYASSSKNFSLYESLYTLTFEEHELTLKLPLQRMTINHMEYFILNHRLIHDQKFKELNDHQKNALIIKIDNEFLPERLIALLEKILKNKLH